MRYEFDWDPNKERRNLRKHQITFRRASTIFRDPNQLSFFDEEHSEDGEDRWITIGFDNAGILRIVVHTFEQLSTDVRLIRIISARKATRSEERQYQEANQ